MAQPLLWLLILFLSIGTRASKEVNETLTVKGILGEAAILPLNVSDGLNILNIAWSTEIPVATVQPKGKSANIFITHEKYDGRLTVSNYTYNLEISNLRMEDARPYKAFINYQTSSGTTTVTKSYTLQVYRRLAKPKIYVNNTASENGTCNITLTCFVEKEGDTVHYKWTPLGEQAVESNGKSKLVIFQRREDTYINYTCTATNPVSSNSDFISSQYFCSEIPAVSSSMWISILTLLVLLTLFSAAGIWIYRQRKKKKDAGSPSIAHDKTTKDSSPLAETQVYDEILMPKEIVSNSQNEECINTIYYTVQKPQKMEKFCSSSTILLENYCNESVI